MFKFKPRAVLQMLLTLFLFVLLTFFACQLCHQQKIYWFSKVCSVQMFKSCKDFFNDLCSHKIHNAEVEERALSLLGQILDAGRVGIVSGGRVAV